MIVLVTDQQHATGKTVVAVNLAAMRSCRGFKVALIDTDRRGHATSWAAMRAMKPEYPKLECLSIFTAELASRLSTIASNYDDVVIDGGMFPGADRVVVPNITYNDTLLSSLASGLSVVELVPQNEAVIAQMVGTYHEVFQRK